MLQKLHLKSEFLKSVVVLTSGTVMAQAVGYLVMPLLTRMYSEEEFGEWGIYMRLVAFISTVATARYELSLPLPKQEGHGYLLYQLSIRIARIVLITTLITAAVYLLMIDSGTYEWAFAGITVASIAFVIYINLGTNWSIRTKAFKAISRQQMVNSISANGFRLLFGWIGWTPLGMLLGTFIGYALSSVWFIRDYAELTRKRYRNYSKKKSRVLLKEYRDFPIVNLPHVTLDLGRDLLIALLISEIFSEEIFGLFNHSYLVLRLPLVVVGVAIGRVFYQRCLELINNGQSIMPILRRTIVVLILLSIVPFGLIYLFGEPMFSFVFGEKWGQSGFYSEIMAIWSLTLFVASPLSSLPLVLNRQREFFLIGIIGSAFQLIGFGILPFIWGTSESSWIAILWTVSIAQSFYFTLYTVFILYYAKKGKK